MNILFHVAVKVFISLCIPLKCSLLSSTMSIFPFRTIVSLILIAGSRKIRSGPTPDDPDQMGALRLVLIYTIWISILFWNDYIYFYQVILFASQMIEVNHFLDFVECQLIFTTPKKHSHDLERSEIFTSY